jgi:membrane-associated phospholipid phosphatase
MCPQASRRQRALPRSPPPSGRLSGSPPQRRPTGAPPPLPYRLQTSGVGWLVAAVVLVGLALVVFARGLRGPAVAVTVADDAVVRWLGGLRAPGLEALWQGLAHLGSWWVLFVLPPALLLALLVLRRWRHLIVWLVAWILVGNVAVALAMTARRPRPFGVDLRTSWGGWALPSIHVAYLAALLVGILYALVPEGRWRNMGKWLAAGLVALVGLARIALGVDAPSDVLLAAGIGVAIPLLAFRRFAPGEVFPVVYRRGRTAHLDIGGAARRGDPAGAVRAARPGRGGGQAVRAGRLGRLHPAADHRRRRPAKDAVRQAVRPNHLRADAGTSSAGNCCPVAWRTRSRSTPCAGWCSRRTTTCG